MLGPRQVADKSNEITAVPELLRSLELAGCIVTLDAMGCQKQIAREIIEADADYVLALKGNQPAAHEEISAFHDDAIERKEPALDYWETVEKGHGRLETRRYWQSDRIGWFAGKEAWESLRSVGVVEAVREIDGKISVERRYYLSSLPLDTQRFGKAVRSHWGVENQLHRVLDVVFKEDQSRARHKNAGENLATLRRWSLNLIKADKLTAPTLLRQMVETYSKSAPELAVWLETNVPESLTVFDLPPEHWVKMCASNMIERVNQELKRRTRVIRVFPNIASLLRMITARLCEISDSWESGKFYLNMHPESQFLAA